MTCLLHSALAAYECCLVDTAFRTKDHMELGGP